MKLYPDIPGYIRITHNIDEHQQELQESKTARCGLLKHEDMNFIYTITGPDGLGFIYDSIAMAVSDFGVPGEVIIRAGKLNSDIEAWDRDTKSLVKYRVKADYDHKHYEVQGDLFT